MDLLAQFKNFLQDAKNPASAITIKNYRADIGQFLSWFEAEFGKPFEPNLATPYIIELYKEARTTKDAQSQLSPRTFERHASSLRKFFHFLKTEGLLAHDPFEQIQNAAQEAKAKEDPWHLKDFKNNLYVYNASHLTIKNYIMDVKQFLSWTEEVTKAGQNWNTNDRNLFNYIDNNLLEEYKNRLVEAANLSPVSINRKLSSIRKFVKWARDEGLVSTETSSQTTTNNLPLTSEKLAPVAMLEVRGDQPEARSEQLDTDTEAYSPLPPVRLLQKASKGINFALDKVVIAPVSKMVEEVQFKTWKLKGGDAFSSIQNSQTRTGEIPDRVRNDTKKVSNISKELYAPLTVSTKNYPLTKKFLFHARYTRPNWYRRYHSYSVVHYFHLAILMVFMTAIGFSMYRAFVADTSQSKPALASGVTAPLKVLSFQGRLTDAIDNPITVTKQLRFIIYNDATASSSARMWEEVRTVTPDSDGIFSVLLGSNDTGANAALCNGSSAPSTPATTACGIPQSLFGQNQQLYLGVSVGTDTELTPRQELATVAYATNSELLQGLAPITDSSVTTNTNTVLALNSSGVLSIPGSAETTFQATNGQFTLKGSTLVLSTNAGSNGNVVLLPDGSGAIDIQKPILNSSNNNNLLSARGAVEVDDLFAILATSSGQSALTINQNGSGPLISASTSGTAKFTLASDGTLYVAGNVGIGSTNPGAALDVAGDATISGNVTLTGNAPTLQTTLDKALVLGGSTTGDITISPRGGSGNLTLTNLTTAGGILFNTNSGLVSQTTSGITGQCLTSNGGGTPYWGGCGGSVGWINELNGALVPLNTTLDFLIGGISTPAAKFAVLNMSSGTPIASLAAGTNSTGIYLKADGSIQTVQNNNLTIGGDSTGDIILKPRNGSGNVGINSTAPQYGLDVNGTSSFNNTMNLGSAGSRAQFFWSDTDFSRFQITAQGSNALSLGAGGTSDQVVLNTSGSLGIGTTNPLSTIDVWGNNGTTPVASFSGKTNSSAVIVDNSGNGDIFTASSSGLNRFVIRQNGSVGIGTTLPLALLDVNGSASVGGNLTFYGSNRSIQTTGNTTLTLGGDTTGNIVISPLNGSGTLTLTNLLTSGGILYTNGSGTVIQASGTSTQVLHGGTTPTFGAVSLTTDISGTLPILNGGTNTTTIGSAGTIAYSDGSKYLFSPVGSGAQCLLSGGSGAPVWGNCAVGSPTNWWDVSNGALYPINTTLDFLLGSTSSSSALFSVLGLGDFSATNNPSASLSATTGNNTGNGIALTGSGNVQSLRNNTLTVGGNTTGNIVFSPR